MGNIFTATEKWYDANRGRPRPSWPSGRRASRSGAQNQATIIKTYPQHFAVEEDEDVKAMQDYLAEHDWFVDTVYLDDEWIDERDGALRPR